MTKSKQQNQSKKRKRIAAVGFTAVRSSKPSRTWQQRQRKFRSMVDLCKDEIDNSCDSRKRVSSVLNEKIDASKPGRDDRHCETDDDDSSLEVPYAMNLSQSQHILPFQNKKTSRKKKSKSLTSSSSSCTSTSSSDDNDDDETTIGYESPPPSQEDPQVTAKRCQPKETLRPGDVVAYQNTTLAVAGSSLGRGLAVVLATRLIHYKNHQEEYPLVLSNGTLLPANTPIQRIAEYRNGTLYKHHGRIKPIFKFKMSNRQFPGNNGDVNFATGLLKQAQKWKQAKQSLQAEAVAFLRGDYEGNCTKNGPLKSKTAIITTTLPSPNNKLVNIEDDDHGSDASSTMALLSHSAFKKKRNSVVAAIIAKRSKHRGKAPIPTSFSPPSFVLTKFRSNKTCSDSGGETRKKRPPLIEPQLDPCDGRNNQTQHANGASADETTREVAAALLKLRDIGTANTSDEAGMIMESRIQASSSLMAPGSGTVKEQTSHTPFRTPLSRLDSPDITVAADDTSQPDASIHDGETFRVDAPPQVGLRSKSSRSDRLSTNDRVNNAPLKALPDKSAIPLTRKAQKETSDVTVHCSKRSDQAKLKPNNQHEIVRAKWDDEFDTNSSDDEDLEFRATTPVFARNCIKRGNAAAQMPASFESPRKRDHAHDQKRDDMLIGSSISMPSGATRPRQVSNRLESLSDCDFKSESPGTKLANPLNTSGPACLDDNADDAYSSSSSIELIYRKPTKSIRLKKHYKFENDGNLSSPDLGMEKKTFENRDRNESSHHDMMNRRSLSSPAPAMRGSPRKIIQKGRNEEEKTAAKAFRYPGSRYQPLIIVDSKTGFRGQDSAESVNESRNETQDSPPSLKKAYEKRAQRTNAVQRQRPEQGSNNDVKTLNRKGKSNSGRAATHFETTDACCSQSDSTSDSGQAHPTIRRLARKTRPPRYPRKRPDHLPTHKQRNLAIDTQPGEEFEWKDEDGDIVGHNGRVNSLHARSRRRTELNHRDNHSWKDKLSITRKRENEDAKERFRLSSNCNVDHLINDSASKRKHPHSVLSSGIAPVVDLTKETNSISTQSKKQTKHMGPEEELRIQPRFSSRNRSPKTKPEHSLSNLSSFAPSGRLTGLGTVPNRFELSSSEEDESAIGQREVPLTPWTTDCDIEDPPATSVSTKRRRPFAQAKTQSCKQLDESRTGNDVFEFGSFDENYNPMATSTRKRKLSPKLGLDKAQKLLNKSLKRKVR